MLLVLPVSHVDLDRAITLARRIAKFGGMEKEVVMVSATWNAAWDIRPVLEALVPAFQHTLLHKLETENEMGWPESANHMFYETARYLHSIGLASPWYFMEADCLPLQPGWFEALKREYMVAGKPYMGVVNSSRWLHKDTGAEEIRGEHMVGTGIYPPDFLTRSKLVHQLDIIPWDVAIQDDVVPECHHTSLIAHRWGTCNYRRMETGQITCDDVDPKFKYAAPIPGGAVVVHGCKDGSLDKLLDASDSATTMPPKL